MQRREYLAISGLVATASIAGCGGSEDGGNGNGNGNGGGDDESGSPTPTDATNDRTVTPTEPAEATATDEPTATGESTATAQPTATAAPTASPSPTPSPTAEPTPTPVSDGERYDFSGQGQRVTDEFTIEGGFTSFDMAHDGSSNFQVELIDSSSGDTEEYLANEIGAWEALLPYHIPAGEYVLDINADGNWEIIVRQPRHTLADADSVPVTGSDEYSNYLGPVEFEGFHRVRGEYNGDSNFAVWLLDDTGDEEDLLFNEIGEFEGETTTDYEGLGYIRVEATGPWQIDVE